MTPEAADMIADALVTKLRSESMFAEPGEPGTPPADEPPPPVDEPPPDDPPPGKASFADRMLGYR
jgi:hypothetical protein